MRFFRGNRFALIFFALLIFCSAMVVRQFRANQSKHVELRENFVLLWHKDYKPEAKRLFKRLMDELESLPNKALMDDYQYMLMLDDPEPPQRTNLIWFYQASVSNELKKRAAAQRATVKIELDMRAAAQRATVKIELDKRPESALRRALKMAEEEEK